MFWKLQSRSILKEAEIKNCQDPSPLLQTGIGILPILPSFKKRWTHFRKMKQLLPEHKVRTIDFSSTAGIFQNASISNHSTVLEGIDWKRRGLQKNNKIQPILYKCFDCFFVSICSGRFNLVNPSKNIHHLADRIAKPGHPRAEKRHQQIENCYLCYQNFERITLDR